MRYWKARAAMARTVGELYAAWVERDIRADERRRCVEVCRGVMDGLFVANKDDGAKGARLCAEMIDKVREEVGDG